jgi:hypothetical protein
VIIDTIGLAMSVHEWDGTTLVTRTPAGGPPSPRFQPAATFDPSRGVTVLCGGEAAWLQSGCDDTWAWDGQGWRQLATVPPAGATWMAFDSTRGRLVATGAYHLMYWSWFTAGIWERDASGWRQLATSWPPRPGPIVFDPLRNQTVLVQPVDPAGPWLWSGTSWTTATVNPAPIGRDGAAMAFDLARGEAVLFGGTIGTTTWFNDTWLWNGSSWRQAAPTAFPGARYGHALAYDPIRQRTVLFGGTGPLVVAHSDTWEWDGQIWSPQTPAASPPPRIFHAMAFDASRSVVSVSGGTSPRLVIGSLVFTELPLDLWDWNGVAWQNTLIATAPMRRLHAMAFDGTRNRLVVQGGLAPESTVSTGLFSPMSPSSDTLELVRNGAAIRTSASPCSVSGPRLRAESLPFTGNASFALQLALADASSLAMLGLSVPGATPPLVFANGCRLHLGVPTVASFQITNPGGAARWAVGVAANPALRGIQLLAQGAAFDATLQPRTTELLVVTIGE